MIKARRRQRDALGGITAIPPERLGNLPVHGAFARPWHDVILARGTAVTTATPTIDDNRPLDGYDDNRIAAMGAVIPRGFVTLLIVLALFIGGIGSARAESRQATMTVFPPLWTAQAYISGRIGTGISPYLACQALSPSLSSWWTGSNPPWVCIPSFPEPVATLTPSCPSGGTWTWLGNPNVSLGGYTISGECRGYTCPATGGWTLEGNTCVRGDCPANATSQADGSCTCNAGYVSDGAACYPYYESKLLGPPPPELSKCNPVNAGTGDKYDAQLIHADPDPQSGGLHYALSYNSRPLGAKYRPSRAHGRLRTHSYEHQLSPEGTGSGGATRVTARRPDGRLLVFIRQGDGQYRPDADIPDHLLRLVDANGATTGWHLIDAANHSETYSPAGRLHTLADARGRRQTLAHDANGRLDSITDAQGRRLSLAYDTQNRIMALTRPDGQTVRFGYDAIGNLVSITWPDGTQRRYHYETPTLQDSLTGITDENGNRYATYAYDAQGRAILTEHAGGAQRATLEYGVDHTIVTDALGTRRTDTLTPILGVIRGGGSSQPGGSGCGPSSSAIDYDDHGNIVRRSNFNGHTTTYRHDLDRLLETQRVDAVGTPEARTVSTEWHPRWRLPVKLAVPLKLITLAYNGDDGHHCAPAQARIPAPDGSDQPIPVLCRQTEQATTDANGSQGLTATVTGSPRSWSWTYDSQGNPLSADGPRSDVDDRSTYTYHSSGDAGRRGRLAGITNALGHTTRIDAYDANGRPLVVIDPNGLVTTLAYDARGRLTHKTVGAETTTYRYDGAGQLTGLTLPNGASLAYTYDAAQRLTGIADGEGNRITYTLDAMGNRLRDDVADASGGLARTRQRAYDALNRLYQDIGARQQITRYAYDANGNLTGVIDPLGRTTTHAYDALDRLVASTDPAGGITRLGHDGQDRTVRVIDPRELVTAYVIDGLGNRTQLISPDTGITRTVHDAAGNPVEQTDARGDTARTTYDALDRPLTISYSDGREERYLWDAPGALGRLGGIEERQDGSLQARSDYQYDAHGRLEAEIRQEGTQTFTTRYTYQQGELASITYPSGRVLAYQRDGQGRIAGMTLTDGEWTDIVVSDVRYHPFSGVQSYVTGSGQSIRRSQDTDGRPSGFTLGTETWQLDHDEASRLVQLTPTANPGAGVRHGYDRLDRLVQSQLPATTATYAYDPSGNRTARTQGSRSETYQTDPTSNRLLGIGGARSVSYLHDAAGNRSSDGTATYRHDARGRLIEATTPSGTTRYRLDALGQRRVKANDGGTLYFVYDREGRLLSEATAEGKAKREYLWLDDLPVGVLQ
jgi:YD repeat-containing protein